VKPTNPNQRRGAVLVQFALLVAVLLGIAAVASDLGLLRVTQVSMQNAADAAALEGLRWVDREGDGPRRLRAKEAVRRTFDADGVGVSASGLAEYLDDDANLGAGHQVEVLAAAGIHGAGGLVPSSIGFHKPDPQANSVNLDHGDLVAGTFAGFDPSSGLPTDGFEDSGYQRDDFAAASPAVAHTARAFLARLRRTPDYNGLDAVDGVSSTGGGVPILFGLGPLTLTSSGAANDLRRDGVAVRATAIAGTRAALRAGPRTYRNLFSAPPSDLAPEGYLVLARQTAGELLFPLFNPNYTGLPIGFVLPVLSHTHWIANASQQQLVVDCFDDGRMRAATGPAPDLTAAPIGWVHRAPDQVWTPQNSGSLLEVGSVFTPDPFLVVQGRSVRVQVDEVLVPAGGGDPAIALVPIGHPTSVGSDATSTTIVGFVACEVTVVSTHTGAVRLALVPRVGLIQNTNGSAHSPRALSALASDVELEPGRTLADLHGEVAASGAQCAVLVR